MIVVRRGPVSFRAGRRTLAVAAALSAVAAAALVAGIAVGEYPVPPLDVLASLAGAGDPAVDFVVLDLRLPRVLTALLAGAALAMAGAIFQQVARNPLVSPDIVGVSGGASLAAVAVIVFGWGAPVPLAALAGALVGGAALYALAWRDGVQGQRFVLVGIGTAALARPASATCSRRAGSSRSAQAYVWLVGSVNGRGWEQVWPLAATLALLAPALGALARRADALELGDDLARSLGVPRRALAAGAARRRRRAHRRRRGGRRPGRLRRLRRPAPRPPPRPPRLAAGPAAARRRLRRRARGRLRPRRPRAVRARRDPRRADHLDRRRAVLPLAAAQVAGMTLEARALSVAYDRAPVLDGLELEIPRERVTAIVGANGCGKSTLLRALARLIAPRAGSVLLDGREIRELPSRDVARRLGVLPQSPVAPEGLTVADLVARGRYPHQGLFRQWSPGDELAVEDALAATGMGELRARPLDELSGGQRQRAWIAMALAQETELLLLDEPTTFLDLAHQLEVLDLLDRLVAERGRTVVMVLHDLNQACRYADLLVALRGGRVRAAGPPEEIVDAPFVRDVFGLEAHVVEDPVSGTPLCLPTAVPRRTRCAT